MNVVRVKPGCQFAILAPAGIRILCALDEAARAAAHDLTITCGTEGHAADDPHTTGEAYDVSVAGLSADQVLSLRAWLMKELGAAFTVLYESPTTPADARLAAIVYPDPHTTAPHLHVQRRNRTVYPPIAAPPTVTA